MVTLGGYDLLVWSRLGLVVTSQLRLVTKDECSFIWQIFILRVLFFLPTLIVNQF